MPMPDQLLELAGRCARSLRNTLAIRFPIGALALLSLGCGSSQGPVGGDVSIAPVDAGPAEPAKELDLRIEMQALDLCDGADRTRLSPWADLVACSGLEGDGARAWTADGTRVLPLPERATPPIACEHVFGDRFSYAESEFLSPYGTSENLWAAVTTDCCSPTNPEAITDRKAICYGSDAILSFLHHVGDDWKVVHAEKAFRFLGFGPWSGKTVVTAAIADGTIRLLRLDEAGSKVLMEQPLPKYFRASAFASVATGTIFLAGSQEQKTTVLSWFDLSEPPDVSIVEGIDLDPMSKMPHMLALSVDEVYLLGISPLSAEEHGFLLYRSDGREWSRERFFLGRGLDDSYAGIAVARDGALATRPWRISVPSRVYRTCACFDCREAKSRGSRAFASCRS